MDVETTNKVRVLASALTKLTTQGWCAEGTKHHLVSRSQDMVCGCIPDNAKAFSLQTAVFASAQEIDPRWPARHDDPECRAALRAYESAVSALTDVIGDSSLWYWGRDNSQNSAINALKDTLQRIAEQEG